MFSSFKDAHFIQPKTNDSYNLFDSVCISCSLFLFSELDVPVFGGFIFVNGICLLTTSYRLSANSIIKKNTHTRVRTCAHVCTPVHAHAHAHTVHSLYSHYPLLLSFLPPLLSHRTPEGSFLPIAMPSLCCFRTH